jgi:probable FeS assembly SUF system protein SufT
MVRAAPSRYNGYSYKEGIRHMERVELAREIEGVQVPAGNKMMLEKGLEAFITQSLGGTFTLQIPAYGGLFRVAGKDADALGKTPGDAGVVSASGGGDLEAMVWEQLKTCFDPEIPVNIVDLGLVYGMEVKDADDGTKKVEVKMTLTAQGCGMGASIATDARHKIMSLPGVSEADVDLVWDPPWTPQMISPEGRERLGID